VKSSWNSVGPRDEPFLPGCQRCSQALQPGNWHCLGENDCDAEYTLVAITRSIIHQSVILTQNHKLRGYDAVQLATALTANEAFTAAGLPALTFVAADGDLLTTASAEGLATENPNLHP